MSPKFVSTVAFAEGLASTDVSASAQNRIDTTSSS